MNSSQTSASVRPPARGPTESIAGSFDIGLAKARGYLPLLAATPASWAFDRNGDYASFHEGFFEIGNWTTSFFTGIGVLGFLRTGDEEFLSSLEPLDAFYQRKVGDGASDTMHDLGFLYSLYSVAQYQVTGQQRHRECGLRAAGVLADRFIPEGDYIRAWGRMDEPDTHYAGLAIIDCLMNMPLLYWASRESGDSRFRDIAIRHTDTTLKHFVRDDASVYHSFRFDTKTGSPSGGDNYCGRNVDSHWARGTSWAMYGFALAYRHTGNIRYLDASQEITRTFISKLDAEVVPVWDFRLEPGAPLLRDSSAAAVAICAIQELESLDQASDEMSRVKQRLLARLCSDDYLDTDLDCHGLLKNGEVGDGVGKARSAYTSWGDYYFMEALARELGVPVTWW